MDSEDADLDDLELEPWDDLTDSEREAREGTEVVLDETSQEFVNDLINKLMKVCDIVSGHPLRNYQKPFARRIFESMIINDGATITALFARQTGKSETVANVIATAMIMLPLLAKAYPDLLGKFAEGLWVGAFAPVDEQADNLFGRIVARLTSDTATAVLQDPEINDEVLGKGRTVSLRRLGSLVRKTTAHPRATIEGRSYHIILIDECQGADDKVVNKSIGPMGAAYNATMVFTGTPTYCLDEETEILTKNGWKYHRELTTADSVLSVNTDTREIHWSPVKEVARFEVDEELTRWQGEKIDALSTSHHRWFVQDYKERHPGYRTGHDMPLQERLTQELGSGRDFKLFLSGGEPVHFPAPTLDDDLVELIGWVVTEGCFLKDGGVSVSQDRIHNPAYCDRLDRIAKKFGASVYEYEGRSSVEYYFGVKSGMAQEIRGLAPRKQLTPEFLTSLSREQAELLHSTLIDADGSRRKHSGQEIFIQKDEGDPVGRMNSFQMLSAMLGKATRVKYRKGTDSVYTASVYREKYTEFRNVKVTREHYQGVVWCPVTADGTWLARRNGVTYWTGNTKNVFYNQIQQNKREMTRRGRVRPNHFEVDWREASKENDNYKKFVQKEMLRLGEDSDEFKLSYRLMWLLDKGMFTTSEKLDLCGDVSMQSLITSWTHSPVVVGIDCARKQDRTIVTVIYVDWDHPDELGMYHHRVLNWLDLEGRDWEEQYFQIIEFLSKYNVWKVGIDVGGVGDVVAQRLRLLMPQIEVIDLGSSQSEQSDRWKYLRSLIDRRQVMWPAGAKVRRLKIWRRFRQEMEDLEINFKGPYVLAEAPNLKDAHDDYADSLAIGCVLTRDFADEDAGVVEVVSNPLYAHRSRRYYEGR